MARLPIVGLSVAVVLLIVVIPGSSLAQSDRDVEELLVLFEAKDLYVSAATRHEKPLSQVAENITIVTSRDMMGAHTLADVLASVVGVQLDLVPSPGIPTLIHIQGSESRQVRLVVDNVSLNGLSDYVADLGAIPVQNIERIEIIKGPASSAWGSSSGGIINVITKSPPAGGHQETLSASYGERNTSDLRTEASGKEGVVGYYLSLGRLHSNGFSPNMGAELYNAYGKLQFDLGKTTSLKVTFASDKGMRGFGLDSGNDLRFDNTYTNQFFTANITSQLSDKVSVEGYANHRRADFSTSVSLLSEGISLDRTRFLDRVTGLGGKVVATLGRDSLVAGVDYSKGTLSSDSIRGQEQGIEERGAYINYTLVKDRFSLTPGLRFDDIPPPGPFLALVSALPSCSIRTFFSGRLFRADSARHLLRRRSARPFSLPPIRD